MKLNLHQQLRIVSRPTPQTQQSATATKTSCPHQHSYQAQVNQPSGYNGQKLSLVKGQSSANSYRNPSTTQDPEQMREAAFKLLKKLQQTGALSKDLFDLMQRALTGGGSPVAAQRNQVPATPIQEKPAPQASAPKMPPPPPKMPPKAAKPSTPAPKAAKPAPTEKVSEQEVVDMLWRNFEMFASASGDGDKDSISTKDLEAIRDQPGVAEKYKKIARFLLQNKVAFNVLETRNAFEAQDGVITRGDVTAGAIIKNQGKKIWEG